MQEIACRTAARHIMAQCDDPDEELGDLFATCLINGLDWDYVARGRKLFEKYGDNAPTWLAVFQEELVFLGEYAERAITEFLEHTAELAVEFA